MHRFRKKSDAHRSQSSSASSSAFDGQTSPVDSLPELPPVNDFRTSLILPDLSRRFSLLRSSTSDPSGFDYHLRTRFADQRAKGVENQITEEEEDMLLDALGRMRIRHSSTAADKSQESVNGSAVEGSSGEDGMRDSVKSTPSTTRSKRYSNNLFGSGRLRDYSYLKNVTSSKSSTSSTRTVSLTPTEASLRNTSTQSLRPVTPEGTNNTLSVQSSPNTNNAGTTTSEDGSIRSGSGSLGPPAPYVDDQLHVLAEVETRLQKRLGPSNLKRASLALEQAIKEIEDEVEEEILLPRTTPVPRGGTPDVQRDSHASNNSSVFEGGMAISIDQTIHDQFNERRASPIPTRTVPGYVPGMPRPMTPRDFEFDEQRSHSTTPRAQSPFGIDPSPSPPSMNSASNNIPLSMKPRRDSTSSQTKPMPAAPLFLQRSTNGRFTPTVGAEDSSRSGNGDALEFDSPHNSSILGRRRPASPLAGPPYQPLAVSTSRPNSRPSTPSNVIWTPNSTNNGNGHRHTHSRSVSSTTDGGMSSTDYHGAMGSLSKPGPRTLRSPALPDSPTLDNGLGPQFSFSSVGKDYTATATTTTTTTTTTPPSSRPQGMMDFDFGSPTLMPIQAPRSDTPTQVSSWSPVSQWSPVSPTFSNFELPTRNGSRRSSRQNAPASPFNISTFPGLAHSPRGVNSSRSSLDSDGSSFHSWDEPDKVFSVFSDAKEHPPVWHDLVDVDKSNNTVDETEEWDAEEVLKRYGGLKKADFAAIQEKLVAAAFLKIANTDPRDRAPSALRRRRPSTSQSINRIASPPPQPQPPASPTYPAVDDQFSKASALLNSLVVESTNDQPKALNTGAILQVPSTSSDESNISPATRRNRALARVLFGEEDSKEDESSNNKVEPIKSIPQPQPIDSPPSTSTTSVMPSASSTIATPTTAATSATTFSSSSSTSSSALGPPPPIHVTSAQPGDSPYLLRRQPSMPKIPQTAQEQADLVLEVQKKAEAAMVALNKTGSLSRVDLPEGLSHSTSIRKRIDPRDISEPKLVSSTTNLDAMPLTNLNNGGTSKLGSRFKKLRGSLRAKNVVVGDEPASAPALESLKTPPPSQVAYYDPATLNPPIPSPSVPLSASSDSGRFKVPVQSPPASAGPGLKGFMARFRNKQRMSEMPSVSERSAPPLAPPTSLPVSPISPMTPRAGDILTPKPPPSPSERSMNLTPRPPGQPRPMYSRFPPANLPSPSTPVFTAPPPQALSPEPQPEPQSPQPSEQSEQSPQAISPPDSPPDSPGNAQSAAALQQLFRAAKDLGLDKNALNDLLVRSGSTSSKNMLGRNNSVSSPSSRPGTASSSVQQVSYVPSSGSDQTMTAADFARLSAQQPPKSDLRAVTPDESGVGRKLSVRKVDHLRKPKEGQTENNAVVRRTIIYANDAADFAGIMQRKTSTRRKRASAASISSRSIHDRVPTPPPPKSSSAKRFSADGMPPMPQLPNFLGQGSQLLNAPTSMNEKVQSTYDSLYDMYGGESRGVSMAVGEDGQAPAEGGGPALEVIQLANGETIWNIVNGLRDGDDASVYSRTSFTSEYSTRDAGNDAFAKGHNRSESKGSVSSFISNKKKGQQGKVLRPETKVFYSTSEQIGRLIESLSQGADAGSFNFLPNLPNNRAGHSASSSLSTNDINWTVEERLDRMLGAMGAHAS